MLRVADRDAKWAKWRAMASGVLDKSKLGRVLTARNVGAAGALVAAVGAGFLASRYIAESKKNAETLRLDLDSRVEELRSMLEEQKTGLEKKIDDKRDASVARGRATLIAYTAKNNGRSKPEAAISAQSGSEQADQRTRIVAEQMVERSFSPLVSRTANAVQPSATGRMAVSASYPAVEVSSTADRGTNADLVARLLSLAESLAETDDRANRLSAELLSARDQMLEAKDALDARYIVQQAQMEQSILTMQGYHGNAASELQSVRARLDDLAAALASLVSAGAQRFGSAPLVLTLARALSAVRLPDRPEIARQMARVILATAALEAHREATESGRVADLYTTDRAD